MSEMQEIIAIEKDALLGCVADLFAQGYRLVQIGCTTLPAAYELNYSFDRDYVFKNLRLTVTAEDEVQSVSVIYPNAFLYENEIHDLFGIRIKNISIDYKGTFYRTALKNPFSIENLPQPEPPKQPVSAPKSPEQLSRQPAPEHNSEEAAKQLEIFSEQKKNTE
jgi:ech hydrogenase subunit D